jgi:ABC-type phosphate/phosphonate transport system substrate-binding protein
LEYNSWKEQLRRILLQMDQDAEGQEVLGSMGVDRFVLADDRLYDSARRMLDAVGGFR